MNDSAVQKKIVVVDNSTTILEIISFVLGNAGYNILQALDGRAALDQLGDKVDLIITDLDMPHMDGFQLIRQIRAGHANKYTPILMLTTASDPDCKQTGKDAGITGWIVKPFNPETLLAIINKMLR